MPKRLSKFTHVVQINKNIFALFNSLWLRVLFFDKNLLPFVDRLIKGLEANEAINALDVSMKTEGEKLLSQMLLEKYFEPEMDASKLLEIADLLAYSQISVMYLMVTNECNLACSYCYLSDALWRGPTRIMNVDTARRAINLFADIVTQHKIDHPQIIFYGGEPLLNKELLKFALEYATPKINGIEFMLNTNGTKIDSDIAKILRDYNVNVSLSIDGPKDIHDKSRLDRGGQETFGHVVDGYRILRENGVNAGVSCTLTRENIPVLAEVTRWLIEDLNVPSLGFNIMIGDLGTHEYTEKYAQDAADALIEAFKIARGHGVYEDRVMRLVGALSDGQIRLNDCAGCGQQIVITPDGQIGVCQAFMNTGQNFFPLDMVEDLTHHNLWATWRKRSPFNIPECLKCECLGICGGGCPYNSLLRCGDIMKPDTVHCVHAKKTLHFLLTDLWEMVSLRETEKR